MPENLENLDELNSVKDLKTENEVTEGLRTALGQFERTVTIATPGSAEKGNREKTQDVTIRKFNGLQFADVFDEIDALVQKGVVRLTDDAGNLALSGQRFLTEFKEESMILRGGKQVLNMIAIAANLPRSHVYKLDLLDLVRLFSATWEVQQRFFDQNQTEFKQALGPIWDLIVGLKATKQISNPAESSPDSSTSSSAEATEPSEK